jgi:4'-phosphopantetheinyl transferase
MLLHLLQTLAAHPALAEGVAPPGLLHPSEQAQLDAFRVVKRRRDWLLGRWTAKHLIQQYLFATTATHHSLPAILILPASDGAPYASLLTTPVSEPASRLSLSISHSADRSFCALTDEPGATVGADIERIEPREPGFVEQFFTPAEIAAVRAAPPDQRDMLITAIWSAKEAVLKALRVGLRADTRHLTCTMANVSALEGSWNPFLVEFNTPGFASFQPSQLTCWWQTMSDFILTLACCQPPATVSN